MNGINQTFLSNAQIQDQFLNTSKSVRGTDFQSTQKTSFSDIFSQKLSQDTRGVEGALKFSKHATNRLADRGIELTDDQMGRLEIGTNKALQKGIKDSLVMVDNLAFIVNIPNNTVVTAMDQTQADENIFTNIDGAVIA